MKLIHCSKCHDIVALYSKSRTCLCGASGGMYTGKKKAVIWGEAIPLGMANQTLLVARILWKDDKRTAFINCWTIDITQKINDVKITEEP